VENGKERGMREPQVVIEALLPRLCIKAKADAAEDCPESPTKSFREPHKGLLPLTPLNAICKVDLMRQLLLMGNEMVPKFVGCVKGLATALHRAPASIPV